LTPELEFKGDFDASAKSMLVPGAWFIGFACVACRDKFALLDDPTGSGNIRLGGNATLRVTCPHCGDTRTYAAGQMLAFQAATGRSSAKTLGKREPQPSGL